MTTSEAQRVDEDSRRAKNWKRWGPQSPPSWKVAPSRTCAGLAIEGPASSSTEPLAISFFAACGAMSQWDR
jgi:hypothetical protein